MHPAKIIEKLTAFASNTGSTREATNSMYKESISAYYDGSESSTTSEDYDTSSSIDTEISESLSLNDDSESSSSLNEGSESSSSFDAETYDSAWRYQVTTPNELNVFEMADTVVPFSREADEIPYNIAGCQVVRWGTGMTSLIRPGTIPASVEFLVLPITYQHSIAPSKLSPQTHVIVHISNIAYGPTDREFSVWSYGPGMMVTAKGYTQLDTKAIIEPWVGFGESEYECPIFFLGVRYNPVLPEVIEPVCMTSPHEELDVPVILTSVSMTVPAMTVPAMAEPTTTEPTMTATPTEPVPTDEDDQPHMCINLKGGLDVLRSLFPVLRTNYGRWVRALTAADPINPDA